MLGLAIGPLLFIPFCFAKLARSLLPRMTGTKWTMCAKRWGGSYASALSASDPGIAALAKTVKLLTEEESLRRSFFDHQFSVLLDALLGGLEEIFLKG